MLQFLGKILENGSDSDRYCKFCPPVYRAPDGNICWPGKVKVCSKNGERMCDTCYLDKYHPGWQEELEKELEEVENKGVV